MVASHLIGKATTLHFNRVDATHRSILAVKIELSLVQVKKTAFKLEMLSIGATRHEEHREQCEEEQFMTHTYFLRFANSRSLSAY